MIETRYTVAEIDRIRAAGGCMCRLQGYGTTYNQADRQKEIEERARTYLIGGVTADEVEAHWKEIDAAFNKALQEDYERRRKPGA